MLKGESIFLGEIRKRSTREQFSTLVAFLLLTFLAVPEESRLSGLRGPYVQHYELDIVKDDVLAVYVKPMLESVLVECVPLGRGGPFELEIQTDHTDSLFGRKSAIWVRFLSQGSYNVTIALQSNQTWDYTIGVYARNLEFYRDLYGKNLKTYGYFVEPPLGTPSTRPSGNWTIIITVNSHSLSSSIFSIELPTPVNSVLLVTAAGFIVYFNVFLFLDTYFKNKKEIVSNRRWFLSGIVLVVSALAIYQLYTFTTFTLSGGV